MQKSLQTLAIERCPFAGAAESVYCIVKCFVSLTALELVMYPHHGDSVSTEEDTNQCNGIFKSHLYSLEKLCTCWQPIPRRWRRRRQSQTPLLLICAENLWNIYFRRSTVVDCERIAFQFYGDGVAYVRSWRRYFSYDAVDEMQTEFSSKANALGHECCAALLTNVLLKFSWNRQRVQREAHQYWNTTPSQHTYLRGIF